MSLSPSIPAAGPEPITELYRKLTVAAAVFFATFEASYFFLSGMPAWSVPVGDSFGAAIGRDFLNTWMGGRSALGSGPAAWFDYPTYNMALREILPYDNFPIHYWSYPPHILLFIWPFGIIPYFPGYLLWTGLGIAVLLFAAHQNGTKPKDFWFLALAPAAAVNIFIGQNGFFTAALLIAGLGLLDRRPWLSGLMFGLLSLKPQLGLLLPIMLLLTGRWRVVAGAALSVAVMVGLTALLYGPEIWVGYVEQVLPQQRWLMNSTGAILFCMIPSTLIGARFAGMPLDAAWALQWIATMAALAAVTWTYWRARDPVLSKAVLITATFVASPYTLTYDMVVFSWVILSLRDRTDNSMGDHILALAVWTLPVTMLLVGPLNIPLGALVLPAFLGRLVWRLARMAKAAEGNKAHLPLAAPAAGH